MYKFNFYATSFDSFEGKEGELLYCSSEPTETADIDLCQAMVDIFENCFADTDKEAQLDYLTDSGRDVILRVEILDSDGSQVDRDYAFLTEYLHGQTC